jgi:hypothetical protein
VGEAAVGAAPDYVAIAAAFRATGGAPLTTFETLLEAGAAAEAALPLAGFLDPTTPAADFCARYPRTIASARRHAEPDYIGAYDVEVALPEALRGVSGEDLAEALGACYAGDDPAMGGFALREGADGGWIARFDREWGEDIPFLAGDPALGGALGACILDLLADQLDQAIEGLATTAPDLERLDLHRVLELMAEVIRPLREGRALLLLSPPEPERRRG